jgi:mono/diheme cytochrome c family protein
MWMPRMQEEKQATALVLLSALVSAIAVTGALAAMGPFTKQQAENGQGTFNNYCAECHRPDLTGALGPSLVSNAFKQKWEGKPVSDLRDWIYAHMPQNAPGSLPDDKLDPIVAWILLKNGVQPGEQPLSKGSAGAAFPRG